MPLVQDEDRLSNHDLADFFVTIHLLNESLKRKELHQLINETVADSELLEKIISSSFNNKKWDELFSSVSEMIKTYSCLLNSTVIGFNVDEEEKLINVIKLGEKLQSLIVNETDEIISMKQFHVNKLMREVKSAQEKLEKQKEHVQKMLTANVEEIIKIEHGALDMKGFVEEKLKETETYSDEMIMKIKEKEKALDKLLGIVSGKKIAGKYEESAGDERTMANWLRWGSIACMGLLVIVVGYSFWETTTDSFKWENSIFRVVLAFFLSVPAAYLAKESAKHREQQYNHLQTSLDLNAIDPFIASLPKEEQDKIKTDIAGKIFASKNYSKVNQDTYPINTHELLMELLKKLDLSSINSNSSTAEKTNNTKSSS